MTPTAETPRSPEAVAHLIVWRNRAATAKDWNRGDEVAALDYILEALECTEEWRTEQRRRMRVALESYALAEGTK